VAERQKDRDVMPPVVTFHEQTFSADCTVITMHARFDLGGSGWSLWETSCGANQGLHRCRGDIAFTKRVLPTKPEFQPSLLQLLQVDGLRKVHHDSICPCHYSHGPKTRSPSALVAIPHLAESEIIVLARCLNINKQIVLLSRN
jgi:hypothetical protein